MMDPPARPARWAGSDGSSDLRARRASGRSGVHRRFCCFACRPIRRPPPPYARSTPIGTALRNPGHRRPANGVRHLPTGEHLPDRLPDSPSGEPAANGRPIIDVESLHRLVLQSLDDDQAVEVISIPLAGKSSIADHMVIASGRSTRQVASMAGKLAERIKQASGKVVRIEGLPVADWVLIDADDVIVHLFRPEVRSFYNLERMWAFGDEARPPSAAAGG